MTLTDPIHLASFAALAFLFVLCIVFWRKGVRADALEDKVKGLKTEIEKMKAEPVKKEYRMERCELVWYPTVTSLPQSKEIISVAPGVPHCRKCLVPLKTAEGGRKEWCCPQCDDKHAESVVDVPILESVTEQALAWFKERHVGYGSIKKPKGA